jgi:RND superfamily putative drug exporter
MAGTGRVITSGALIMIAVFLAFVASPVPSLKMLGLGLATAILVDATLVRMVLVPATMALLGKANWWLPGWLDKILPHLTVEGAARDSQPEQGVDGTFQPAIGGRTSDEEELVSR